MTLSRPLEILPQPDETTCGPTCLQAIYRYFGQEIPLQELIDSVPRFPHGGTLAVMLGCHALRHGYHARIYTYNLDVFDPTWFQSDDIDITERLTTQLKYKTEPRLVTASHAYLEFLRLGGELLMETLSENLIAGYLEQSIPVLTGLSVTYLYQCSRERETDHRSDDLRGVPTGHFVVLCGIDRQHQRVLVADPYLPNPLAEGQYYHAPLDRLISAILLGVLTYDANLLVLTPSSAPPDDPSTKTH
ncbi:MAG: C39 family peptidase [Pirellulales bacterium]